MSCKDVTSITVDQRRKPRRGEAHLLEMQGIISYAKSQKFAYIFFFVSICLNFFLCSNLPTFFLVSTCLHIISSFPTCRCVPGGRDLHSGGHPFHIPGVCLDHDMVHLRRVRDGVGEKGGGLHPAVNLESNLLPGTATPITSLQCHSSPSYPPAACARRRTHQMFLMLLRSRSMCILLRPRSLQGFDAYWLTRSRRREINERVNVQIQKLPRVDAT